MGMKSHGKKGAFPKTLLGQWQEAWTQMPATWPRHGSLVFLGSIVLGLPMCHASSLWVLKCGELVRCALGQAGSAGSVAGRHLEAHGSGNLLTIMEVFQYSETSVIFQWTPTMHQPRKEIDLRLCSVKMTVFTVSLALLFELIAWFSPCGLECILSYTLWLNFSFIVRCCPAVCCYVPKGN